MFRGSYYNKTDNKNFRSEFRRIYIEHPSEFVFTKSHSSNQSSSLSISKVRSASVDTTMNKLQINTCLSSARGRSRTSPDDYMQSKKSPRASDLMRSPNDLTPWSNDFTDKESCSSSSKRSSVSSSPLSPPFWRSVSVDNSMTRSTSREYLVRPPSVLGQSRSCSPVEEMESRKSPRASSNINASPHDYNLLCSLEETGESSTLSNQITHWKIGDQSPQPLDDKSDAASQEKLSLPIFFDPQEMSKQRRRGRSDSYVETFDTPLTQDTSGANIDRPSLQCKSGAKDGTNVCDNFAGAGLFPDKKDTQSQFAGGSLFTTSDSSSPPFSTHKNRSQDIHRRALFTDISLEGCPNALRPENSLDLGMSSPFRMNRSAQPQNVSDVAQDSPSTSTGVFGHTGNFNLSRRHTESAKYDTGPHTPRSEISCCSQVDEYRASNNPRFQIEYDTTPVCASTMKVCGRESDDWGVSEMTAHDDLQLFEQLFINGGMYQRSSEETSSQSSLLKGQIFPDPVSPLWE